MIIIINILILLQQFIAFDSTLTHKLESIKTQSVKEIYKKDRILTLNEQYIEEDFFTNSLSFLINSIDDHTIHKHTNQTTHSLGIYIVNQSISPLLLDIPPPLF